MEENPLILLRRQAFKLAYTERMNELRGRHVKRFDSRGLHPYSVVWGHIMELSSSEPHSPVQLRNIARAEADLDYYNERVADDQATREALEEALDVARRDDG